MIILEEIIRLYREKAITLKEAADKIIEVIYKNPHYFMFEKMHEDQRSEFILLVYSRMEQIIQTYDPSKSLFRTFLVNAMLTIRKSMFKTFFRESAQRKAP